MALYRHRQFSKGPLVFSSSFFRGIFKRMWYISLSIRTCLHDIVCFLEYLISCSYWGWNKNYSLISKLFFPIISLSLSLSLSREARKQRIRERVKCKRSISLLWVFVPFNLILWQWYYLLSEEDLLWNYLFY